MKAIKQITIAIYNVCHGHCAGFDWRAIAAVRDQEPFFSVED